MALDLVVEATGAAAKVGTRRVPIRATLRHALVEPQAATVTGGQEATGSLSFPAPANASVELELLPDADIPEDLSVALDESQLRLSGEPGGTAEVSLSLAAADCCSAGDYPHTLRLHDAAGGPTLELPVTITVVKPSFPTPLHRRLSAG